MASIGVSTVNREADPSLIQESWTFHVSAEFDADEGVFVATCEEYPDFAARGDTEELAVEAVAEMLVERLAQSTDS